ncbi:nitroreductase [Geothermobacter ehrlichii]|uniref:Nitroreductase n=1 Tax=Geothermobacter ehrlichii TaxID=213224 RepID=A0A5D3WQW8_9BACT|nr:nitroreductase family protein [Geothermobacter ehrlichii]TYO99988.1 nitroreductase [Geothermobacter ehrlichii]
MLDILRRRRSIRRFAEKEIEAEKIAALKEAILRAPTSRGLNSWEFIFVDDRELLHRLAQARRHGSAFLAGAKLAVVVAADPERCDVWIEDCAIAAIVLQLAAVSLGLDSCWAQIRLREHDERTGAGDYVRRLLGLPERFQVACVIGIGYAAEQKESHARDSLPWDRIHDNRYRGE